MHIGVIGAGGSGLCAVRYITEKENNFSCTLFEQQGLIGGTWVYTECVGKDQFGIPVHSSMYKNLMTNLPKEAMEFPGFHFKKFEESYIHRELVFEYLNAYADKYNLRKYIKVKILITLLQLQSLITFYARKIIWNSCVILVNCSNTKFTFKIHYFAVNYAKIKNMAKVNTEWHKEMGHFEVTLTKHHVKKVSKDGEKWKVIVKDLLKNEDKSYEFDAVIISSGHNSDAVYPVIKGMETFSQDQIHSHDYRTPERYKNERVLIIGAGPSGVDIAHELSHVVYKVIWSHHSKKVNCTNFPDNIIIKPDVQEITGNNILFKDGSVTEVDSIIYCTGYRYSYPFLDESCLITTNDNYVRPLYRQMINIYHPTMCFTGIPKFVPQFPLFDMQVRYFLKLLINGFPNKEYMLQELKKFEEEKSKENLPKKCYHALYKADYKEYFKVITDEGGIEPIPDILFKIHESASMTIFKDFTNFRNNIYKIINENEFIVYKKNNEQ
ncbi:senecionine N-oxygenase-like [Lycorma delicatula]|uniref:senecionine N-oxygenase-like n=1 Tax=Lycorma delicatula TaxID=130591 RepID=UPI003F5170B5